MKFFHISDLHLGKRLNEFSLIEDQRHILYKILNCIDSQKPDAVLIAGDVYDKGIPTIEAVSLFDDFLYKLSQKKLQVFIISGNHDSPERMTCGTRLMESTGIHFAQTYDGTICKYTLQDEFGPVNIYLLPFIKPAVVKAVWPDDAEKITDYSEAVSFAIQKMNVDTSQRNVLVAHQYVTGTLHCDSEEFNVGGLDNVDFDVFDSFDYVALGHLHGHQKAGRNEIRYSGSPLKYSFSEVNQKKGGIIVQIAKKGEIEINHVELEPLRNLRELKGTYEELTLKKNYENTALDDFIHITLTDEDDVPEGFGKLCLIYKNLVKLDYDNQRTRTNNEISGAVDLEHSSPLSLFEEFYKLQNNMELSDEQKDFMQSLIENLWESDK